MGHEPVVWKTHSTIICKDCEQEKDPVFCNGRPYARCQECINIRARNRRHEREVENPELRKRRSLIVKEADWKRNYGLTREKYDEMFRNQGGVCAICKQEPTGTGPGTANLHVDHDHKTNEIRGLLCNKCNHAIGLLNEDQVIFLSAYDYLSRTTWYRGLELVQTRKKA